MTVVRYVIEERQGFAGCSDVVVDSTDGRELCLADASETPEDANVYRAFEPLLDEANRLASELSTLRTALSSLPPPELLEALRELGEAMDRRHDSFGDHARVHNRMERIGRLAADWVRGK